MVKPKQPPDLMAARARRVMQIQTHIVPANGAAYDVITALCDDGTIWTIDVSSQGGEWSPVPPIPQPTPNIQEET
jgi:hypothetical protein